MLTAVLALLAITGSAHAQRFEFGPLLSMSTPTAQVGDKELGITGGVTFTATGSHFPAIGFDLVYHYWPASADFKDDFDALLHDTGQKIDAETWAFSAFQATVHVKIVAPVSRRFRPWFQVGAGPYRVNRNLTGLATLERVTVVSGGYGSIGIDLPASPAVKLGLAGAYHRLWSKDALGSDFGAFEVGAHLLFGV